mmetsp:Transcript_55657/g.144716  ORF Transcript_55657/g.144716 Transcript_55657/m.144716 type:complete len:253 (+) Transcript_55657:65-823(+)
MAAPEPPAGRLVLEHGSVPSSRFVNPATGRPRTRAPPPDTREGQDGAARLGLAAFMGDSHGKQAQDVSVGRLKVSGVSATMPSATAEWRPHRATAPRPAVREPPVDRLSQRPPYLFNELGPATLLRGAAGHPPYKDLEEKRFQETMEEKAERRTKLASRVEASRARALVRGLEDWERSHAASAPVLPALPIAAPAPSQVLTRSAHGLPSGTFRAAGRAVTALVDEPLPWYQAVSTAGASSKAQGIRYLQRAA